MLKKLYSALNAITFVEVHDVISKYRVGYIGFIHIRRTVVAQTIHIVQICHDAQIEKRKNGFHCPIINLLT